MNLHSCRTYIRNRSVLKTTATTLDTVAKPACSLNHIPKSPSFDRSPAHPDTIKTAIERGLSLVSAAGEDILISRADQHSTNSPYTYCSTSLHKTLDVCINPLDDDSHPGGALMNIFTGQIVHTDVKADDAYIGQRIGQR